MKPVTVVIIGGGVAGLGCAGELAAAKIDVVVFDKGRNIGGRLASKDLPFGRVDHGAQFLRLDTSGLRSALGPDHSLIRVLEDEHSSRPRWLIRGGARCLAERLAASARANGTEINTSHKVESLARVVDQGLTLWRITVRPHGQQPHSVVARHLILAIPAPQAIALLKPLASVDGLASEDSIAHSSAPFEPNVPESEPDGISIAASSTTTHDPAIASINTLIDRLRRVRYARALTAMLHLPERAPVKPAWKIDSDDVFSVIDQSPKGLLPQPRASESRRGDRSRPTPMPGRLVAVTSTPAFAERWWPAMDPESSTANTPRNTQDLAKARGHTAKRALTALIKAATPWIGDMVEDAALHHWGYSHRIEAATSPVGRHPEPAHTPLKGLGIRTKATTDATTSGDAGTRPSINDESSQTWLWSSEMALGICGDSLSASRVSSAHESGVRLAKAFLDSSAR